VNCASPKLKVVSLDVLINNLQVVEVNQDIPEPLVLSAWSKAAAVDLPGVGDYSLYADFIYKGI
jgi:hypothetical protein